MSRGDTGLPMALVLGAVLLVTGATAVSPALPAPRDLARSVLETHGQELRLLKVLGVARTVGTGRGTRWGPRVPSGTAKPPVALSLSASLADVRLGDPFQHQLHRPPTRLPQKRPRAPRRRLPSPAGQGKRGQGPPGHKAGDRSVSPRHSGLPCPQAQRCTAQVSVFAFLPDVPLSMVECGQEPVRGLGPPSLGVTRPHTHFGDDFWLWGERYLYFSPQQSGGSTQPRTPGTPGAAGTSAGHPSSSSSSSPRPPPRPRPPNSVSLLGTSRRPLSPVALE